METILESDTTIDLNGKNIEQLIIKGNNVIVRNLKMTNLQNKCIQLIGHHITLDKCSFSGNEEGEQFIQVKGSFNRLTNCLFENFNKIGCIICIQVWKTKPSYCLIDNCNFRDMKEGVGNGWEVIRIGDSKTSLYDSKSIIFNNFFSSCDREIELISVKSCANIVAYNKIIDCKSGIVLRHGRRNKVLFNYINGNHREGCPGIRITGKQHTIMGNTIEKILNKDNPFRTAISLMNGEVDNKLNGYEPVKICDIRDNDILSCEVAFSLGVNNKRGIQVLPTRVSIETNRVIKCLSMLNDNEKCEGLENSFIDNNDIIEEDVKLVIQNGFDITETIEELYQKLDKGKVIEEEEEKEKEKPEKEEPKKKISSFADLIEEIERLQELEKSLGDCMRCSDLVKTLNDIKKRNKEEVEKLKEELKEIKDKYKRIEDMLLQQLK